MFAKIVHKRPTRSKFFFFGLTSRIRTDFRFVRKSSSRIGKAGVMNIVCIKRSVRVRGNLLCLGGIKLQSQDKHGYVNPVTCHSVTCGGQPLIYLFQGKMVCNTM